MKYSGVLLALAAVVAAKPVLLNSAYNVVEGQPFTLTFEGCEDGCTITLENGPEDDLQTFQELTSAATGGSFTVTLDKVPTDNYAFKITDSSGDYNYSPQFLVEGTGVPETTIVSVATSTHATTTATEITSTEATTTPASTTLSTMTTPTPSATETEASATETEEPTEKPATTIVPSNIPDNGAGALARPIALVAAAVGAMLVFN